MASIFEHHVKSHYGKPVTCPHCDQKFTPTSLDMQVCPTCGIRLAIQYPKMDDLIAEERGMMEKKAKKSPKVKPADNGGLFDGFESDDDPSLTQGSIAEGTIWHRTSDDTYWSRNASDDGWEPVDDADDE